MTARTDDEALHRALRHPLRREILCAFAREGSPLSPRDLAEYLGHPVSNTAYHVRILAETGAVELVDTKPIRGSLQHFYVVKMIEPWALTSLGLDGREPGFQAPPPA
jgi:DNA-binding transcriptional ArsR family regulator